MRYMMCHHLDKLNRQAHTKQHTCHRAQRDTRQMRLRGILGREKGMGVRNINKRMNE